MEAHDRGTYQEFKVDLIQSTILDTDVLDNLISKCILTLDDREEIDSLSDQSNRNQKLLEILMQRPYNTFSVFVEVIKNSDQKCHTALVERVEAKVLDKDLALQKAQLTDVTTGINDAVKLIKWYKTIVHEINIDKTGILDKLFTQDVIDREVYEKLSSVKMTSHEKNRRLLGILVRKNISSAFPIFLEVLREDSCYKDFADKIEETHVTQNDLELLSIGNRIRERKRNGMSDLMVDQIEKWKIESKIYVQTRATDHVLTSMNRNNCVSVIGPAGSGKTAIARHVALQMERLGYTILTVTDAKEIKDLYKSDRKTLYVVDDMCGNFTASQSRIEEWKKSMTDIKGILENGNCKLILTCRLQVFQDKGFTNLEIFKTCVCNLRSHSLSLTSEEKEKLTAEYFKEHAVEAFERLSEYEFLPFLCKLYYVQRNNPEFNVQLFLDDPFSFYKKELRSMYNDCAEGRYKYCALLLLVIFNNKLEEKHLTGKDLKVKEIIKVIIEECEIEENITGRKLKSQLEILTGTFVTYDEGIYKTIHDKLFDFLAVYFGTQEELISILIKYAKPRFVRERFSVTKDIENELHLIPISDEYLQMYMKRVFEDMVSSCDVNDSTVENINLKNIKLRTMLHNFMRNLNNPEISALLETASTDFVNVLFIMKETDIKEKIGNKFREYQSFSIILPDDLVQAYIKRWFGDLTKTNSTKKHFEDNRLLKSVTFRKALNSFMIQINPDRVASIIQTGSKDFLNTMFVITEHDIKDFAEKQYERFGIIIPERMLQHYIDRWFDDLTRYMRHLSLDELFLGMNTSMYFTFAKFEILDSFICKDNRLLRNLSFRDAVRTSMRQLARDKISSLINTADDAFLNTMFVTTEDDIINNAENEYEWFGIVIPDDLLQQYIEQYFNRMTNTNWMVPIMYKNRTFQTVKSRTALRTYMKQLTKVKIASLIQNAVDVFFHTMFVMADEDIKEYSENRYECFGIVFPYDLLNQYIQRWFEHLTNASYVEDVMDKNRLFFNVSFRCTLRNYMRQLPTEKIASIIQTSKDNFFNRMFVMTEDDIIDNSENQYECIGIVIPYDLLQQYIQRWFDHFTNARRVDEAIHKNRLFFNVSFRCALRNYMRQLPTEKIASIIQTSKNKLFNQMFVMTEEDIIDNAENRYECIGIVIPDELLQQYCQRWLDELTKTKSIEAAIDKNRTMINNIFRIDIRNHLRQLTLDKIALIIQNSSAEFINKMFVMTEQDIHDNTWKLYKSVGIVIPDNLLQPYVERWLKCLAKTTYLEKYIDENRPLENVAFRAALNDFLSQLNIANIASLIGDANDDFLNKMFVVTEDDIQHNAENHYECFGIVIPNDLLQQYIERWFKRLTETYDVEEFTDTNRPLKNVTFRSALCNYMRQLSTEKIASLILTAHNDFFQNIFVMTEEDTKDNAENRYECFGIVIPDNLLQLYLERWLKRLTKTSGLEKCIDDNRPLKNVAFCAALNDYLRQLNTETITSLIWDAEDEFLNKVFVMTEEDIHEETANRPECLSIVIPGDLFLQYIERWFKLLTKTSKLEKLMDENRPFKNITFRTALYNYMKQLNTETIASLILNADVEFLQKMFVVREDDIKHNAENQYECFGIVISDNLFQHYIEIWLKCLTKTSELEKLVDENRPLENDTFRTFVCNYMRQLNTEKIAPLIWYSNDDFLNKMFVMTEDVIRDNTENRYECFGIVIPDNLLQHYIERWLKRLTKTSELEKCIDENRPLKNVTFRTSVCDYMRQLNTEKIAPLIWDAKDDFLNKMFVMTEDDIRDNTENGYEWFGIIIPADLLKPYIDIWLKGLTETRELQKSIDKNRPQKNALFRSAFQTYMEQTNAEKIATLIQTGSPDFLNTMFVMEADEIKYSSETRYACVGIVIPEDLLQQYIEKWVEGLTITSELEKFIDTNRPFKIAKFRTALCTYLRQLNPEKIVSLILECEGDYLNKMFVMTDDDIKENAEDRYECFGIVIPDDMLQQYIERWFLHLSNRPHTKSFLDGNRLVTNVSFCTAFRTFMEQLNTEQIAYFIQTGSTDFLNTMFVMTENDIKDDGGNRYEWFGIVIADDLLLLQQYIERWFKSVTEAISVKEYMNANRSLTNATFRTALRTYMSLLDTEEIGTLICTGSSDFLNTMFVLTEIDIVDDNAKYRFESFGIVIPDDILQQYIDRWLDCMTKTDSVMEFVSVNRSSMSFILQTELDPYMNQIYSEK